MKDLKSISRRKFLYGTGATVAGAAILTSGLGFSRPARAAVTLKLSHSVGPNHPVFAASERIAKNVKERTNGEVEIAIFPNNALGSPPETAQQTQLGAIDFVMMNPPNLESQSPQSTVLQIPYQFDSYEHAHRTLDVTAHQWYTDLLAKNGLTWIANFEYGFRALTNSARPILTPDDIQGLKIRVPPELSIKATFEALGANTQTVAFSEVYLALASGAVDGQDNPISVAYANKFHEVQKHIAVTRHIYTTLMMTANPRSWDRLTDEQRMIITEEATAAGKQARQEVIDSEEQILREMEAAGLQVTRPDVAAFREKMAPAYAQLRPSVGDNTWAQWSELVDAARTA